MPYNRSEKLRRILLIALLAFVLLGAAFGIGLCAGNSCSDRMPYAFFETYDELKAGFEADKDIVFPVLDPLKFSSKGTYLVLYKPNKYKEVGAYEIIGGRFLNGISMQYRIIGEKTDLLPDHLGQSIEYKGEKIYYTASEQRSQTSCSEDCLVSVNGHVYTVVGTYSAGSPDIAAAIGDERFSNLKAELHEQLLEFMRSIVDAAKAK